MTELVLTRRVGEAIAIGKDIVVTVVEIRGGACRLGVAAPREVAVNRAELLEGLASDEREAEHADV